MKRFCRRLAAASGAAVFGLAVLAAACAAREPREEPITPIPPATGADPRKVALGELLFMDPRLSTNGRISCQSCHDVSTNGATGRRFDIGADGRPLPMNTPTVFNAALSFRLNWEGNQRTLARLVTASLRNPGLMGTGGPAMPARLQADPRLAGRFRALYGGRVSEAGIADAVSAYLGALVTPNSRFDRWLEGDAGAITPQEARGYARFKTLGCASCHQGVNVGGNLFERPGVFHPLAEPRPDILRVPSLRNVAATAPYFHDGSVRTLRQAVRYMGRAQLDLALSDAELDDLTAFLCALTGERAGRPVVPARAP